MIYRRSLRFKKAYKSLPKLIQKKTAKSFILFQDNPAHPSLVVKKIQGHTDIWEGRIDNQYRFTFHYEKDLESDTTICVFRNIDNHDECLKNPQPKRSSFLKTETKKLACAEKALVGFFVFPDPGVSGVFIMTLLINVTDFPGRYSNSQRRPTIDVIVRQRHPPVNKK